ncbi:molybdenum cofactor biosynthesis enzyme MoaA [Kitasatospora gansuensis]|uniref:Molybdenum cofactor biosynthesis enzyme MoaA n=1 Tax=Kitasatospora gansuensis TaxID=258050 RepID=A0A7W7S9P0_9ACTN|nr:radical SAM protein [Kitasatospora gansuensis]MBB4945431.1 molybdenum cofactor biosynthesis enzyme MoaA [Kitasatospora gansuensis]
MNGTDQRFHVIVLSNFAKGFDKYAFAYGKAGIPESTFPDRFHLLTRQELGIGVGKARRLLERLAVPGDRLLVLETTVDLDKLVPNLSTGLGTELHEARIRLAAVHELDQAGDEFTLRPTTVEDAMAASLHLHGSAQRYADIRPRSVSILPVASACQARCSFCFSAASISTDQAPARVPWDTVAHWLERARTAGAERAVITGGGEPTLIPFDQQLRLVSACSAAFPKVVLITNGHTLAKGQHADRADRLAALSAAGLSVLAVSRHHQDDDASERLMMLRTPVSSVIDTWRVERDRWPELRMRLICVLQHGGVADAAGVADYLSWAAALGVEEVCFKELYVSTSTESLYFDRAANVWSRDHQVSLSVVTRFAEQHGFELASRLPWGAPVYHGSWNGRPIRIAAYTEPSLLWERTNGIARSWNVLADGRCYASLEDRASEIVPAGAAV